MGTALTIDIKELRDGIAERLNLMLEYARKGDRLLVGMLGKTVEAELRRLITPVRGNTEQPQDRPVAAVQMGLSVDHLKEIRTLIFQAGTAFTGGNRDAAVALIHRALAEWQRI